MNSVSLDPPDKNRKSVDRESQTEKEDEEEERPVGAKNMSMTSSGEKVVTWTRSE